MIRFNISRLLRDREESEGRRISWREVSEATGVSVSVLSTLASPRGGAATNTRFVEALCRYFRCTPGELLVLEPGPEADHGPHVDELYPEGGAHRARQAGE